MLTNAFWEGTQSTTGNIFIMGYQECLNPPIATQEPKTEISVSGVDRQHHNLRQGKTAKVGQAKSYLFLTLSHHNGM